ncbi:MAG: outer membrane protein assembly factor BamB [Gammaproteobacteria bacterium]|nr:outer membrane protein assembly factor BamB [Gammaproteobacteria bacterium]
MRLVSVTFMTLALLACGGAVDNAEPPAPLVEFQETAKLMFLTELDVGDGAINYSRATSLNLEDEIVSVSAKGLLTVFNKHNSTVRLEKDLNIQYASAVGGDQHLYLLGTRSGEVIAIEPVSANVIWKTQVSSEVLARPVLANKTVIVKTVDGQLTALKADSGDKKWIYKRDVPALSVRGNSVPLVMQDKVISALDNGKVVIVNLDSGILFWEKTITVPRGRTEIERLVDLDADLLVNNDIIYIAGFQGRIVALDLQSGEFLWSKKMSVTNNMTFEDNKLYVTDDMSHVWALDAATGATIWKQSVFTARKLSAPVVMHDYLLTTDYQGYLHVIAKADGHQITRLNVDNSGINNAPIVYDDKIYLQTNNSKIYILGFEKPSL